MNTMALLTDAAKRIQARVSSAPKEATAIKAAAGAISFANAFIFISCCLPTPQHRWVPGIDAPVCSSVVEVMTII